MRHFIIVLFADAETGAYHTGWFEEPEEAFRKVTKELAKDRIAWVGWSYFFRHTMADSIIEDQLRDLAKSLINNYRNTVYNRKTLKLPAYRGSFDKPVFVLPAEIATSDVFGFAYAHFIA